jgi:hypothetical protein
MCQRLLAFQGLVKRLLFTHNTLLSVLYTMIMSSDSRFLRCCFSNGVVINEGAQFRYGLDSQYGDVIFVMKDDFWKDMKGAHYSKKGITDHTVVGHMHYHDFIEYDKDRDKNLIDRWLEMDAYYYDIRKPPAPGVRIGGSRECKAGTHWAYSWCNIQLHIGQNVPFEHVERMYAPAWLVHDHDTVARIAAGGVNTTLLQLLVTNQLPDFPHGDHAPNPLNGLFRLYGPPNASHHYYMINKDRDKIQDDKISHHIYNAIKDPPPSRTNQTIPTHRHSSHSSSTVFLHEEAFKDAEIKYLAEIIGRNMTNLDPSEAPTIAKCAQFAY